MLDDQSLKLVDMVRRVAPVPRSKAAFDSLTQLQEQLGRPVRVGVARVDGIGDWILTIPLIESLLNDPSVASLTIFAPGSHRSLLAQPRVEFVPIDLWAAHHTPWPHGKVGKILALSALGQQHALNMGRRLRGTVDLMILPRWDTDRGQNLRFFAAGVDSPIVGHAPSEAAQASPKELLDIRSLSMTCIDPRAHAHESDRVQALLSTLGLNEASVTEAARAFFSLTETRNEAPTPLVIAHTGAHDAFRRWPEQNWADFISLVLRESDASVVLIGDNSDVELHQRLAHADPTRVQSTAGRSPLSALPLSLDRASFFVGGDSGPAHIAAAIGVPTFVISCFPEGDNPSHPNSPDRFAARSERGGVLRPAAQPRRFDTLSSAERSQLIASVSPMRVWEKSKALLKNKEPQ